MNKLILPALVLSLALAAGCASKPAAKSTAAQPAPAPAVKNVEVTIDGVAGFQDTPMQPDGLWHVHDPARPQPPVVTPGNFSQMAPPPSDAVVLFNGQDLSHWTDRNGNPPPWKIEDGVMVSAKSDIQSKEEFGDLQLHVEFREPTPARGEGQGRGNSGVFLMGRYEIQVLDCFENKTYADGSTGGIYGQHPPLVNACRPPGEWQTYDIIFRTPHFGPDGTLLSPGYATVMLNGVVTQDHQAIRGATNWKSPGKYTPHGPTGPIALQFHNNPVAFRNIWVRPVAAGDTDTPAPAASRATPKKLLVVTTTTGFRHSSIPTAEKVLAQLAQSSGEFTVDFVHQPPGKPENPKADATDAQKAAFKTAEAAWEETLKAALQKLSPASLKHYDGVVFASTTGDLPVPDPEGLLNWIKAGHAFIGIHAASDTFHHWPGYIDMLGGEFKHHGRQVSVDCLNQDPKNPADAPLPKVWTISQEEIYQFTNYDAAKLHDLLILDKHPESGAPGHYGVSWCKRYGHGHVFYTSLGHREDVWDTDPTLKDRRNAPEISKAYQAHVLGGIEWALGLKR